MGKQISVKHREEDTEHPGKEKPFSCKMCGDCCYGKGGITVLAHEQERIASSLGMTRREFVRDCCVERNGVMTIRSREDGFCLFFWKGKGCAIQPVKPKRCVDWPFYDALLRDPQAWIEAMDACPGINRRCTHEEFVRQGREELDPEPD